MPDVSELEDDSSIDDSEILYLRVYPRNVVLDDCPAGECRPNSGSFRREEPLSVDLASKCTAKETQQRAGGEAFHVASFTAGIARKQGCRVRRDPELDNDAHALVIGDHQDNNGAMSKSQMKQIAKQARIILWDPRFPKESYTKAVVQLPSESLRDSNP